MINIHNLSFSYEGEVVLNHLHLTIPKHSTCAIIGPSGCGKTTLLMLLAGLYKPEAGSLLINQTPLAGIRQSTGLILQDLGLLPWKTVYDNVALALVPFKLSHEQKHKKIIEVLNQLGLTKYQNKYPHQLSGGQKQRCSIARTLVREPDLLLLDEATSALDDLNKEHLQELILSLYHHKPTTLVLITHNIEEAVLLGKQIVIMDKGQIKTILENPFFGDLKAKETLAFYEQVLQIRKLLKEEVLS